MVGENTVLTAGELGVAQQNMDPPVQGNIPPYPKNWRDIHRIITDMTEVLNSTPIESVCIEEWVDQMMLRIRALPAAHGDIGRSIDNNDMDM